MRLVIEPSPIELVKHPLYGRCDVEVFIKRDDLIHPVVSGNKWRKLKYLLQDAQEKGCTRVLSMGGNWSNHLHSFAYAGKELGLQTEAFVRAHPQQPLTPTLEDCQRWGMKLHFCSRKGYALLRDKTTWDSWHESFADSYWISEGAYNELAIQGVKDIGDEVEQHYDYIFVACGSGTTLCGVAQAFPDSQVIGVAAFSGAEYLKETLSRHLADMNNWLLDTSHHCGGFAKSSLELETLQKELEELNAFQLDKVYNAKTFLALHSWLEGEHIPKQSRVLVNHTGGLQGNRSY